MCIENINKVKKSINKEESLIKLERQIKLINELGEDASKFHIIDRREMTPELIEQFNLALDPNSSSIKSVIPSGEKIRIRVGPSAQAGYDVRYNYDLRTGISGPKILPNGRTRDFCVHLIDANKLYTVAEINRMSNGFDLPVFRFAGGYYTNPDTGETTPYCRHSWYENLVIKK